MSERDLEDDLLLIEDALHKAGTAAFKLETMYVRGEVRPRAELDWLIAALGSHQVKGVPGYGGSDGRKAVREALQRVRAALLTKLEGET
jgi:hypothetical protein